MCAQDFYKDVSLTRLTLLSLPVGFCSLEAGWVVCPESQIDWSWCTTRFKSANKRGCDWCTHSRVQNPNHAVDDEIPIDPLWHSVSYLPTPTTGTTLCHRSAALYNWLLHLGRAYRNSSQMKHFVCGVSLVPSLGKFSQNSNSYFFSLMKQWAFNTAHIKAKLPDLNLPWPSRPCRVSTKKWLWILKERPGKCQVQSGRLT